MVPAEAAGILFTANPMNGHRDEMVINAAWGLGEAIVGGLVSSTLLDLVVTPAVFFLIGRRAAEKALRLDAPAAR